MTFCQSRRGFASKIEASSKNAPNLIYQLLRPHPGPPLEDKVTTTFHSSVSRTVLRTALLGLGAALGGTALGLAGALAAEVTFERLANPEPGNWLMNHHDYGSHRFSALDAINKTNVKNLRLAFAVPLGGSSGNEYNEATPVVEDGFLYITDVWSVVYKIDVRSGAAGRVVWKMDPGTQKPDRNRGVDLVDHAPH